MWQLHIHLLSYTDNEDKLTYTSIHGHRSISNFLNSCDEDSNSTDDFKKFSCNEIVIKAPVYNIIHLTIYPYV